MRNVACLLVLLLSTISTGCRIDPNAEREIALLRSEILDLEDQYYTLQSQCGQQGEFVGNDIQYYDAGQNNGSLSRVDVAPDNFNAGEPVNVALGQEVILHGPVPQQIPGQIYGPVGGRFESNSASRSETRSGSGSRLGNLIRNPFRKQKGTSSGNQITNCDCQPQPMQYPSPVQYAGPVQQHYQPNIVFNEPAINTFGPAPGAIFNSVAQEPTLRSQSMVEKTPDEHDDDEIEYEPRDVSSREPSNDEVEFDDFNADDYSLSPGLTAPGNALAFAPNLDVAGINIDRIASGGQDLDGLPGHEGLVLLIQPESIDGEVVQTPGRLSVEVTDPKIRRPRNSIGSWQFSPYEVQNFFVKEEVTDQGILLHLPWDGVAPANRKLLVHVQFTTDDNRMFEATREFEIEPPGVSYSADDPMISQWVERDDRWKEFPTKNQTQNYANDSRSFRSQVPSRPASSQRLIGQPQWKPVR